MFGQGLSEGPRSIAYVIIFEFFSYFQHTKFQLTNFPCEFHNTMNSGYC